MENKIITIDDVRNDPQISALVHYANHIMSVMGYTEHGPRHVGVVSRVTTDILRELDYPKRTLELAEIAGWVHDVGNIVNRTDHGLNGAVMLLPILQQMGMPIEEVLRIVSAVGNHEEQHGTPVSEISAALIIADKSDAHRSRVRRGRYNPEDIHDRVNMSIKKNWVEVDKTNRVIRFELIMDGTSSVLEFLQIYMSRMVMSEDAAHFLGCRLEIVINGMIINNHIKNLEAAKANLEKRNDNLDK
ncbi:MULTISPECIES: HD domain-containing protein [unclassified Clostridium]|jgi:metal-dependent HD superfamily phosphatase/phosphodiesterase|uniref:HD domain-containing protein n=1 Tax=Clostridia TaxID=186801 RepID=UPI001106F104|nr:MULTISPECIES: HD domain-containing protein [unclassified Clostridium]